MINLSKAEAKDIVREKIKAVGGGKEGGTTEFKGKLWKRVKQQK